MAYGAIHNQLEDTQSQYVWSAMWCPWEVVCEEKKMGSIPKLSMRQ